MAKSRRKRKKEKHPNIPPMSLLRPRLDERFSDASLVEIGPEQLRANLDSLIEGLNPHEFVPILLRACSHAPVPAQRHLDEMIPGWLEAHGYAEVLSELLAQHQIPPEEQEHGWNWLERAGHDVGTLQQRLQATTSFCQGFMYGDNSQGLLLIAWYTDERQRRVQSMSFLIDYNPPWEGAIKDIMLLPVCSPRRLHSEYIAGWAQRGMPLAEMDAAEAIQELLKGLEANRSEEIRLPSDLILARDVFLESILPLLNTSDASTFTAEDFDTLCILKQTTESLRHIEQTVGRRVRLDGGEEILVMGDLFDEEDDWIDEGRDWYDSDSLGRLPGTVSEERPTTREAAGTRGEEFLIEQICPDGPLTWAVTEWFHWSPRLNSILKRDREGRLFDAAYDAVDWESHYERLRGTPFYDGASEGGGILSFGGSFHIQNGRFFSTIGDLFGDEGDYLEAHPEMNQVLHEIHVETAGQMVDFILEHASDYMDRG